MSDRTPDRPRILAVLTAGVASASGFFVITRSGLAGTLAGAAVASMIYTGAAHGLGLVVDRAAAWWIERRRSANAGGLSAAEEATDPVGIVAGSPRAEVGTIAASPVSEAPRAGAPRRLATSWGPVALAVLALGVSGYTVVTGTPLETVVVRERVVERPVVEERVVVEQSTVTVTVPVAVGGREPAGTTPTPAASAAPTTTSEPPSSTTTTTVTDGPTTDTTESATATTTTLPAAPPTTAPTTPGP